MAESECGRVEVLQEVFLNKKMESAPLYRPAP